MAVAPVLCLMLVAQPALAQQPQQEQQSSTAIQGGLGGFPGLGLQVGAMSQRTAYSTEAAFYGQVEPQFMYGDDGLFVAAGFGGSLRIANALNFFLEDPLGFEADVGVRMGPALRFKRDETPAEKNQRFRLFFDPFGRYAYHLEGGRTIFFEAGLQHPHFRAGMWFRF